MIICRDLIILQVGELWNFLLVQFDFTTKHKYKNRYPLTKMLYCSKCGNTLIRRTWNSKSSSKKIVWQCKNYIRNGKAACEGTSIADEIISKIKIKKETIVQEVLNDGKKDYIYSSKNKPDKPCRKPRAAEKEDGCIL